MSPDCKPPQRTVDLEDGPNGRGWRIAFADATSAPCDNVAFTRGLGEMFDRPELVVRGLPRHQARGLLTRVAHRLTSTRGTGDGMPARLSAGHYTIELVGADPSEWEDLIDGHPVRGHLEVLWSSRLVEDAPRATDAA